MKIGSETSLSLSLSKPPSPKPVMSDTETHRWVRDLQVLEVASIFAGIVFIVVWMFH